MERFFFAAGDFDAGCFEGLRDVAVAAFEDFLDLGVALLADLADFSDGSTTVDAESLETAGPRLAGDLVRAGVSSRGTGSEA